MTDKDTFTLEFRIDFGAIGSQPVTVIGTARDCGVSVTSIATEIRSVVMHVLSADQSSTLSLNVTHLLDATSRTDIHERLERRFVEFTRSVEREASFDWESSEGASA